jgi:mRNA interferase MazF
MPSTTTYRRGEVVVVEVAFSDLSGAKRRPALVVSTERFHRSLPDVIVSPISSQPRYVRTPGPGDCPLGDWRRAGLRYPSVVRVSKILAVDKQILKGVVGVLGVADLAVVEAAIRQAFGFPAAAAERRTSGTPPARRPLRRR